MNITITGHQISLTTAIKNYISKRLMKVQRHFDHRLDIHFVLEVEKILNKIEVTTYLPGKDIHIKTEDKDMYKAIDLITDKMDRQILKYKEIHSKNMHSGKEMV
jgi:putative sigma-54 modulation protein